MVFKVNWVHVLAGVEGLSDDSVGGKGDDKISRGGGLGLRRGRSRGPPAPVPKSPLIRSSLIRPRSAVSDADRLAARNRVKQRYPDVLMTSKSSTSVPGPDSLPPTAPTTSKNNTPQSSLDPLTGRSRRLGVLATGPLDSARAQHREHMAAWSPALDDLRSRVKGRLGSYTNQALEVKRMQNLGRAFYNNTESLQAQLKKIKSAIEQCKKDIRVYRADIGGREAVADNNKHVARSFRILEKRLRKEQDILTGVHMDNQRVQDEIDQERRERVRYVEIKYDDLRLWVSTIIGHS